MAKNYLLNQDTVFSFCHIILPAYCVNYLEQGNKRSEAKLLKMVVAQRIVRNFSETSI